VRSTVPLDVAQNRVQPFVEFNCWHAAYASTTALNGVVESLNRTP